MSNSRSNDLIVRAHLIAVVLLSGLFGFISCGDTGTKGEPNHNWVINGSLIRSGSSRFVAVYLEITRDDQPYISGLVEVNGESIRSIGDGTYSANIDTTVLRDTLSNILIAEIAVTTPLEPFNFKYRLAFPDTFSFDFDQLPNNQVFSSTNVVNLRWTASDFAGASGSYFVVTEPTSQANTAVGAFDLFSGSPGSIPPDAFRTSQGEFKTGTYNVWVVARIEQPINAPGLPFTIPDNIFEQNIDRVGVTGQIGALYLAPMKTITAVAGS